MTLTRNWDVVVIPYPYRRSLRDVAVENGWIFTKIGPADWFYRRNIMVVVHYNSESAYRSDVIRYAEIKTEGVGTEVLRGKHAMFKVWDVLTG